MNTYALQVLQTDGENPPILKGYTIWRSPRYAGPEETDPTLIAKQAAADAEALHMAQEQAARYATKTGQSNIAGLAVKDEG